MNTTQFIAMVLWFFLIHIDLLRLWRELAELRSDIKKAREHNDEANVLLQPGEE